MQLRRVIEKLLGATGWSLRRTTGSHNIFGKEGRAPIVVSFHGSQVQTPLHCVLRNLWQREKQFKDRRRSAADGGSPQLRGRTT